MYPVLVVYISITQLKFINFKMFSNFSYPCFENPYPMDIHEAPVTACLYLADCPHDVIPALYQVGIKQKKSGFSDKVQLHSNS